MVVPTSTIAGCSTKQAPPPLWWRQGNRAWTGLLLPLEVVSCCWWPFTSKSCCLQFPHVSGFPSFGIFESDGGYQPPQLHHHPPIHLACHLLLPATTIVLSHAQPHHPQPAVLSHTHTRFHCASPVTRPCPGAASAPSWAARAALAQNGFSSGKRSPLQGTTQPPWTSTAMSPRGPTPWSMGGLCPGWEAQTTPSIS